jgi:hypothetical protein
MFCAPELVFGGTEGVGFRFHVLRARNHYQRYRGSRVPFSCFARPDSFSAVPRASYLVFMFCAPGLNFGGTEGVGSRFHVLRAQTRFLRYRGRPVPFSCFACPDSFSAPPSHGVPFSCFARPDSFSAVPRASCPVFMFCAPGLIFGDTEGIRSRFHVLRARTHFRRYRGRWLPFLSFARSNSFSAVPSACCPVFMFCVPGLIFCFTEGVVSPFHDLYARTRFQRYRGRRLSFSCFALPESFSAVSSESCPVIMFCTPGLGFGGTEGVGSRFHVLRARKHFQRYRGLCVPFSCFERPDSFSTVPFSCFTLPDSFSAVPFS